MRKRRLKCGGCWGGCEGREGGWCIYESMYVCVYMSDVGYWR